MTEKLNLAIEASLEAGKAIMGIYEQEDFEIESKDDDSPLTLADKKANDIINKFLIPLGIPIISEESKQVDYLERKNWSQCWIIDPLDGTKEFIKKNGEFTVNIALVEKGKPVLGVIYAPALEILYCGIVPEQKAFKYSGAPDKSGEAFEKAIEIYPARAGEQIKVVGSRSHMNQDTLEFIEDLKKKGREVEVVPKGSSLKFCLIAEGEAHYYPRFAPTMEWDTAAGQAICEAVGLNCIVRDTGKVMTYNKENLLNDHFSVSCEGKNI